MIISYADKATALLANGIRVPKFEGIEQVARRKLGQLSLAADLLDLSMSPGNRLEKLRGDREGQMSIRINNRWRICFVWTNAGPAQVEIVDYH
jgi:proteic killer suppression protein